MGHFEGQSSVEYVIVFAAFLAMIIGLGLWQICSNLVWCLSMRFSRHLII